MLTFVKMFNTSRNMAKKKQKKQQAQQFLSPENYLRQKARSLEIGTCYVTDNMKSVGEGHVIVTRRHKGGKVSVAFYLVDIWCLGVKDSFYRLRMDEDEFEQMLGDYKLGLRECSYEEAHNWVFGAIAFAEEAGIEPDKSFNLTQYMLEEDDDDIPLIEYEYGENGQHLLVAHSKLEASRYLPLLEKNLGKDNYKYIINVGGVLDDDDDVYDDDYDDDGDDDEEDDDGDVIVPYVEMEYTYEHPEYPTELALHHPWLQDELAKKENAFSLPDELTDRILALPHDTLREDLENLIIYHIGQTCDGEIPEAYDNGYYNGTLCNSFMLLAEVGDSESSLDCALEVLRQSSKFLNYHFGDSMEDVCIPTLYKLGQQRLDKLMAYAKEEGLYWLPKAIVFPTVVHVALRQPERRGEVLEWFREILNFYTENAEEAKVTDHSLSASLMCDMVGLKAVELLPEINALFDTGMVDLWHCGSRASVISDIKDPEYVGSIGLCELDIHKRFGFMRRSWG